MSRLRRPQTNFEKHAVSRVFDASRKLKDIEKLVLSHIIRLDNAEGAYISQTKLAQRLGRSRITIQRTQDQLRHLGLLADDYLESKRTKTWYAQIPEECMPVSSSSLRDAEVFELAELLDSLIPDPIRRPGPEDWNEVKRPTSTSADTSPVDLTGLIADTDPDHQPASTRIQDEPETCINAEHPPAHRGTQPVSAVSTNLYPHGAAISDCIKAVEPDIQTDAPHGANCEAEGRVLTRTKKTDGQPVKRSSEEWKQLLRDADRNGNGKRETREAQSGY